MSSFVKMSVKSKMARLGGVVAGAMLLGAVAAIPASAALITVNFPSTTSTTTAAGGAFFFNPTHMVNETFAATGVFDANTLDLSLDINNNFLSSGFFIDFDVLVDSMVVGMFTIPQAFGTGIFNTSFSFIDANPLSDHRAINMSHWVSHTSP